MFKKEHAQNNMKKGLVGWLVAFAFVAISVAVIYRVSFIKNLVTGTSS